MYVCYIAQRQHETTKREGGREREREKEKENNSMISPWYTMKLAILIRANSHSSGELENLPVARPCFGSSS